MRSPSARISRLLSADAHQSEEALQEHQPQQMPHSVSPALAGLLVSTLPRASDTRRIEAVIAEVTAASSTAPKSRPPSGSLGAVSGFSTAIHTCSPTTTTPRQWATPSSRWARDTLQAFSRVKRLRT